MSRLGLLLSLFCSWTIFSLPALADPVAPSSYLDWGHSPEPWASVATYDDRPHVVYARMDLTEGGQYDIRYQCWTGTSWYTEQIRRTEGGRNPFPSLAMDGNGRPHVSYMDYEGDQALVRYVRRTETGGCVQGGHWVLQPIVDSFPSAMSPPETHPTSAAIRSNNAVEIAYRHESDGQVKYAFRFLNLWLRYVAATCDQGWPTLKLGPSNYHRISCVASVGANGRQIKYAWRDAAGNHEEALPHDPGAIHTVPALDMEGDDPTIHPRIVFNDQTNNKLRFAERLAGGQWSIIDVGPTSGWVGASIRVRQSPRISVAYSTTDVRGELRYAFQHHQGCAFTSPFVVDGQADGTCESVSRSVSLEIDSLGRPHVAYGMDWMLPGNDTTGIKYASWDPSRPLADSDPVKYQTHKLTSLALDGSGYPWMCFYNGGYLMERHYTGAGWWSTSVVASNVGTPSNYARGCSIDVAPVDGTVGIVFSDAVGGTLRFKWKPPGQAWQEPYGNVWGAPADHNSFRFSVDGNKKPMISFYVSGGPLRYTDWEGAWQPTEVDPANAGTYNSLAVDPSSGTEPRIAYRAGVAARYAWRQEGAWQPRETIAMGWPLDTSLDTRVVGDTERIWVAFHDMGTGNLVLAERTTSGWELHTNVDSRPQGEDVGQMAGIKVDSFGKPIFSYFDATNSRLKVGHWNPFGGPNDAPPPPGGWRVCAPSGQLGGQGTFMTLDPWDNKRVSHKWETEMGSYTLRFWPRP